MKKFKKNLFSPTPSVVKKVTAAMLCCMLAGLFLIAGCKKDEKKESYPIDIPFTEYSLPETCQWTNLGYDETVIVVNSMETLKQHIIFPDGNAPEFDFSTNSLLLVSGGAERGISGISKKLQQLSGSRYRWNIEIFLDDPDEPEPWIIAITTNKPIIENAVELNVTTSAVEYPVDVPFELYFVRSDVSYYPPQCVQQNTVIIINSNEELEKYIGEIDSYACIEKELLAIDFSKYSLLFTMGSSAVEIPAVNNISLKQVSSTAYEWDIDIFYASGGDASYHWTSSIITEKVKTNSDVRVNETIIKWSGWDWPKDYSIELFTKNYSLENSSCQWTNLEENKVIIIKNNDELDNYITCDEDTYPDVKFENGLRTLFITKINAPKSIKTISKRLFRFKEKSVLNIEITLSNIGYSEEQVIAFTKYREAILPVELNINIID